MTVAVVQPNVDLAVKWKPEFKDSTFRLIERLAKEAASKDVDMIFFPETSAPVYLDHPRYKDYRQWLELLSERVADLRLPNSVDTYVEIRFFSGSGAPAPEFRVDCTASPDECSRLATQVKSLPTLPRLPSDFPHSEIIVKLSRVP